MNDPALLSQLLVDETIFSTIYDEKSPRALEYYSYWRFCMERGYNVGTMLVRVFKKSFVKFEFDNWIIRVRKAGKPI